MTAARRAPPGDQARISVLVAVPPAEAFRIFTEEIDRWWLRGPRYRVAGNNRGFIHLEPHVGGRVFESYNLDAETKIFETGEVTTWDPPARLVFVWRAAPFAPHETTEVEVTFEASGCGTLLTVTHRGWSDIPADHPARHGLNVPSFLRMMGMWWGDLMTSLRQHADRRSGSE